MNVVRPCNEAVPPTFSGLQSSLMNDLPRQTELPLCAKIARLVQERGWNQDEFARIAELNRLTIRSIFVGPTRRRRCW